MDILVIGGTVFVGRHFANAAVEAGHSVTLFHRGTKGTGLIEGVSEILGDRDGDLGELAGRKWDAVVDTCGYFPRVVRKSAEFLSDSVGRYLFVSTISVYTLEGQESLDEDSPVGTIEDSTTEEITGESYGPLKYLCEQAVLEVYGDRSLIVRPGLINGPNDPTNRFTYWVTRFADGGEVIVTDRPDQPQQLIDARDLGLFMLHALEAELTGTFNACGPDTPKTLLDMIEACQTLNREAKPIWVPNDFLAEQEVELWQELPLILPPAGESDALNRTSNARAVAAGLRFRSWEETAADTLEWARENPVAGKPRHGLDREKEARVLANYKTV